jgi:hypothetical protein
MKKNPHPQKANIPKHFLAIKRKNFLRLLVALKCCAITLQKEPTMKIKRWPIIRHIRWAYHKRRIYQHYALWARLGYLPVNRAIDENHLRAIWRGDA